MVDDQINLTRETDTLFWDRTGHKPGQKLDMSDPKDRAMAKIWMRIYGEVRGHRDRATILARRIHGEIGAPYVFVVERPDGSLNHLPFQDRGQLDAQFNAAIDHPDQHPHRYVASFDFMTNPRGPVDDRFAETSARAAATAALRSLRVQATSLAQRTIGNVVAVTRVPTGQWYASGYAARAEAVAWLSGTRGQPTRFTYAAIFDKTDVTWPNPLDEAIGRPAPPAVAGGYGW